MAKCFLQHSSISAQFMIYWSDLIFCMTVHIMEDKDEEQVFKYLWYDPVSLAFYRAVTVIHSKITPLLSLLTASATFCHIYRSSNYWYIK